MSIKKCFPAGIALLLLLFGCGGDINENMPCSFCIATCGGKEFNPTEQKQYCSNDSLKEYGFITYENKTYKTVEIGNQVWMAENLNVAVADSIEWMGYYDFNKYGSLYDWATAMQLPLKCNNINAASADDDDCKIDTPHKGICPPEWHIPVFYEWHILQHFVDSIYSGKNLKATNGWNSKDGKSGNGYDKYGFAALPGGYGQLVGKNYLPPNWSSGSMTLYKGIVGKEGRWWMVEELVENTAFFALMNYGSDVISITYPVEKLRLHSVRCVKDD